MRIQERIKVGIALSLAIVCLAGAVATWGGGSSTKVGIGAIDRPPSGNRQSDRFAKVRLIDHEGNEVDFYDRFVKDKKMAVNFMYTVCKGICPGMTVNIKKAREELAKRGVTDICFISISIEPDKDTPERLAAYMDANGITNHPGISPWVFLTGDLASIDRLRKSLGVFDPDPVIDADRTQHGGILTFGNDQTNWWGATPALQPVEGIVSTLERLMQTRTRNFPGFEQDAVLGVVSQ
jgi:protein SCO1/2